MSLRIAKINELIRQQLADILSKEVSFKKGVLVTIAKVDTTPDLRYTRISLSIFPEKERNYVVKTVAKEAYQIQGKLNKKLHLRPLPRVEFKTDETEVQADKVERLLEELKREE